MNKWERLKFRIKDVFKKTEPVAEKKEEKIVVHIPVRVAGLYNFYTEKQEHEEYYRHSTHAYTYNAWYVHMNVKAMVSLTINGIKYRFKIEDSIEVLGYFREEDAMYSAFMKAEREILVKEGLKRLVAKKFKEEQAKNDKEAFNNLGRIEFDIKIEIEEEKLKK
ncbi:2Fe-2S ferredoxin-like protein [Bacillus phage vB_BanS_Skywalker]|uniref:2Fe-2S ferredoxin-like protein n=1 Tax=Bacillus phage vB_BanS_Skywalker TaxID=2894789 RepID=A0AAE8YVE7_9CAUD|nr:2Fe-2S ferredoxin-like protein [Bacillus phage vB_BanS_Skywalker]UGO51246.1 2Fe-2S ferredoxin-like protein [Bacillus phage vB_BanS_Skywalker]